MTFRENTMAILNYESYDRLPLVHFGFWPETLEKWAVQGHLTPREARSWGDGNKADLIIGRKLGFDFNWSMHHGVLTGLFPPFIPKVINRFEDGRIHSLNDEGVIVETKKGVVSIPSEIDHLLKNRGDWEKHFRNRIKPRSAARLFLSLVPSGRRMVPYFTGGSILANKALEKRQYPASLYTGSIIGTLRNIVGVENLSYLTVDDPDLLKEMVDAFGAVSYGLVKKALESGAKYDFLHFWEDICYNHGPLINPTLFTELAGPHYKKITDLARKHGVQFSSVDCDGQIDTLLPIWLENGVNIMFPIEVGTWQASIAPWRESYGRELRGVGGMNKVVFSKDRKAIDQEVERLKPLVDLGGYIPCPDHRIAPDAEWDNVRYYCDRMNEVFNP